MNNIRKCKKCGFEKEKMKEKYGIYLCDVCFIFSPNDKTNLSIYVKEKIEQEQINSFRKYASSISTKQKKTMVERAKSGKIMSRAPYGYEIKDKKLISNSFSSEIEKIYKDFLNLNISLNRLSKKYNFSINGLKKILTNFTYIGKIKFDGEIYKGDHEILISPTLFNHVQNKIEKLGIKAIN